MDGLIMAVQLIMGLSLLVILHEFGHYIAARAFGIKVEKFYLFFDAWGFKLFKFKKGDTEYGIGWLPLGGYVKISGMIDESMDKEAMKEEPKSWEFRSKPAWQRLIVMLGGVVMNVIVGFIIFIFINLHYTKGYIPTDEVNADGIYAYSTGQQIGFRTGDKIISVNGNKIERFSDATSIEVLFGAEIVVDRNGEQITINVPDSTYKLLKSSGFPIFAETNYPFIVDSILPDNNADKAGVKKGDKFLSVNDIEINTFGQFSELLLANKSESVDIVIDRNGENIPIKLDIDSLGKVGFVTINPYKAKEYSFGQAVKYGIDEALVAVIVNGKGISKIFEGKEKVQDSLQGPIGIAQIYGSDWGNWYRFWKITGLISMILAVMNILPIPALDGGHVIFLSIEAITGRKFSDNFMEKSQVVGMFLLLALMVFVIGNDIYKLFPN
jgi:regulator of sigma E protease